MLTQRIRNKRIVILLLAAFLVVSIILMAPERLPEKRQARAKTLTKTTTTDGNTERTDYTDEDNNLTVAADFGYATMISVTDDSRRLERFYDEKGEPISIYPGYYGILKEYDNDGRCFHISYLDSNDKPVITQEGYSDIYLTFYDTGKVRTEKYYGPDGNPVCTSAYGYGSTYEYDENGKINKITYLNDKDQPMTAGLGYAAITRNTCKTDGSDNGLAENEYYFDERGEPVALSLGQYGVHKEYDKDGLVSVITYLGREGEPIVTTKGYTTIARTYHDNYSIETERYYDLEGNPFAFSEGQYGIKRENSQTVYLNQDGMETFNLKRLLYNHMWFIIPCAFFAAALAAALNKKLNMMFLILYIAAIAYLTLLFRESMYTEPKTLFESIRSIFTDREERVGILLNIWLFIPLGAILFRLYPRKAVLLVPFALSCIIEGLQLLTHTGYCETEDIVSNSLGGAIGYITEKYLVELKCRYKTRRTKKTGKR